MVSRKSKPAMTHLRLGVLEGVMEAPPLRKPDAHLRVAVVDAKFLGAGVIEPALLLVTHPLQACQRFAAGRYFFGLAHYPETVVAGLGGNVGDLIFAVGDPPDVVTRP